METLMLLMVLGTLYLPIALLRHDLAARRRPDYWQKWGAVVLRPQALDLREDLIGHYMGVEIFEHVRFQQLDYHFSRIAVKHERDAITGGELFLEPGLIYQMVPADKPATSPRCG